MYGHSLRRLVLCTSGNGALRSPSDSLLLINCFCEWASKAVGCEWRRDPPVLPCTGVASSRLLTPTPSRAVCNAAVLWAGASPCPTLSWQRSSTAATLAVHHTRAQVTHRYISANILIHSFVSGSEIPVKYGAEEPQETKPVWKQDSEEGGGLPSRESQSCWDEGSEGRARALYSKTTELEMIWLLMATCSVTRPVSWAGQEEGRISRAMTQACVTVKIRQMSHGGSWWVSQPLPSKTTC